MQVPLDMFISCFAKTAQSGMGANMQAALSALGANVGPSVLGALSSAKDAVGSNLKAHGVNLFQDTQLPADYSSLATIAALLGGGYLAHKGIGALIKSKPAGGFKDQLEKAILATGVNQSEVRNAAMAQQLAANANTNFRKNVAIGSLGTAAVEPYIREYLKSKQPEQKQIEQA